jgi:Asp-tRNA(Asn)/Glu-tRNA(Gln) amidotransferase A subunit family amidase
MLIGKHYDEATIYKAAYAFEQSGGEELKGYVTGRRRSAFRHRG